MGPKAQLAAKQAGEYRQTVRAMPVLQKLDAVLSAADAKNIGVEVVREDAALNVALGMFEMPAIGTTIALPPKSE